MTTWFQLQDLNRAAAKVKVMADRYLKMGRSLRNLDRKLA